MSSFPSLVTPAKFAWSRLILPFTILNAVILLSWLRNGISPDSMICRSTPMLHTSVGSECLPPLTISGEQYARVPKRSSLCSLDKKTLDRPKSMYLTFTYWSWGDFTTMRFSSLISRWAMPTAFSSFIPFIISMNIYLKMTIFSGFLRCSLSSWSKFLPSMYSRTIHILSASSNKSIISPTNSHRAAFNSAISIHYYSRSR